MTAEKKYCVGIDWGSQTHEVCVVDEAGSVAARWSVQHSGEDIRRFVEKLMELAGGKAECVAAGMETPHGAILEVLLELGVAIFAVNPKQLDRFRDRHSVAGAKDDRRDAYVLADALRTDASKFRRVQPAAPDMLKLRELGRAYDNLTTDFHVQVNRLRQLVSRFFPQVLEVAKADEPLCWSLLELAPTPAQLRGVKTKQVDEILRKHRIRRISKEEVLAQLRKEPLPVAPGVAEAATEHVALIIPQLRVAYAQMQHCHRRIEEIVERLGSTPPDDKNPDGSGKSLYSDVKVVDSLKGAGALFVATMFGEAYALVQARDLASVRAQSGIAPVTQQSGKTRHVQMRKACNRRLRAALFHLAAVNIQYDARSRALYDDARARGQSRGRALRAVGDRLLRILFSMLRNNTTYVFEPLTGVPGAEESGP